MIVKPDIVINGKRLNEAQTMTIHVALETFAMYVNDKDFRKDLGEQLADGYMVQIESLREIIYLRGDSR